MVWRELRSTPVWGGVPRGWEAMSRPVTARLNQRALEDDAAIERGDGVPELLPQRGLDLRALGELAAEIDQTSEGPNQIPLMPAVSLARQTGPVLFAGSPTVGRCQVAHLDRHRQGNRMDPLHLIKLLCQSTHALQSLLEVTVLLEQPPRVSDFTFPRFFAQT